jgi:DNA polymerase-3 subunit gamma/tau
MGELDIVANQNLSVEMFLIRLIHLKGISNTTSIGTNHKENNSSNENFSEFSVKKKNDSLNNNNVIEQIKNIAQEEKIKNTNEQDEKFHIKSFDQLIEICILKKEIKLKYELETNVSLVSFENKRIEISFNESLDKEFIKILSSKLYEWTKERWIITLSKKVGKMSRKDMIKDNKKKLLDDAKKSTTYKKILEIFSDAQLTDVERED